MKVEVRVGKNTTTVAWVSSGERVSKKFPGRVSAEYSEARNVVVIAGGDGVIHLLDVDGGVLDSFSYNLPENCKFYILAKSIVSDLGVVMVVAHDPEFKGERFWQHEIDLEGRAVGGPENRWR